MFNLKCLYKKNYQRHLQCYGIVFLLSLTLMGCGTVHYQGVKVPVGGLTQVETLDNETQLNINALTQALIQLSPTIKPEEAKILANEAFAYPLFLANTWNVSYPPLLNNYFRNSGRREYGLCIDWTYAMRERMRGLHLSGFDWHWGIANQGSELREHSTLVVTAKGQPFETGIILDPWRNSGRLFWTRIGQDPKYNWNLYIEPEGWTPSHAVDFIR